MPVSLFGSSVPTVNVAGTIKEQQFTAVAGQTLFTLTLFTYSPGSKSLWVFINGVRQDRTTFTETSSSSFTLGEGCDGGEIVTAIGLPVVS